MHLSVLNSSVKNIVILTEYPPGKLLKNQSFRSVRPPAQSLEVAACFSAPRISYFALPATATCADLDRKSMCR
jgi:hypothetical protein